jgi:arylsulfatase A-like enzyme
VLLLTLLGVVACSPGGPAEEAAPELPDAKARYIVLITVDTLRADHLQCYGYPRETSPRLNKLTESAVLYRRALSTAPWTLPSHASLFTGLYPFEHGARTFEVETTKPLDAYQVSGLDDRFDTLAEVLRDDGYTTVAFAANTGYLSERFRMHQGFDKFVSKRGRMTKMRAMVCNWLETHDGSPFFLFLNVMDTHRPYNTKQRKGFLGGREIPTDSLSNMRKAYRHILGDAGPTPSGLLQELKDQYDLAITHVDQGIDQILKALQRHGWYEDAMIVITSDHGEFFGEHGLIEHSKDVYQPVLQIPLIIKYPRQTKGAVDSRPISQVHVPRLILERALTSESPDLFPYAFPDEQLLVENYFTRRKDLSQPWGERFKRIRLAFYEGDHKYIFSSDGEHELYDLSRDPDEQVNLITNEVEAASLMDVALQKFREARTQADAAIDDRPLSDEEMRNLEELGYR